MEKLNLTIKFEKNLDVTELDGEKVMIDFETGKYFMIKGSGNDIWDIMTDGCSLKSIVDELLKIYDVDEKTCSEAVVTFVGQMVDYGFVSLS